MTEPLLDLVNAELLPTLEPLGFKVVESSIAPVFDNATVVLHTTELRVAVERDRGFVQIAIGPVREPGTSFDPGLLLHYFNLSSSDGPLGPDARAVLRGAGAFITSMYGELQAVFAPQNLARTKRDLNVLAEARAARLFGP